MFCPVSGAVRRPDSIGQPLQLSQEEACHARGVVLLDQLGSSGRDRLAQVRPAVERLQPLNRRPKLERAPEPLERVQLGTLAGNAQLKPGDACPQLGRGAQQQVHALAAVETAHAEHHKPGGTGRSIFLPEQLTPCSQIDHLGNDAGFAGYTVELVQPVRRIPARGDDTVRTLYMARLPLRLPGHSRACQSALKAHFIRDDAFDGGDVWASFMSGNAMASDAVAVEI